MKKKKGLLGLGAIILALSLVVMISGASWAKDTAQLDYADIALRVPKENKQLDILQRSLPLLQKNRDDMANAQNSMGNSNAAMKYLTDLYLGIIQNSTDDGQKAWASEMLGSLAYSQSYTASPNYDAIDMQIAQIRIQISQTQDQLINGGQQIFVGYYKLQDAIKKMRSSRVLLEDRLKLARTQQAAGSGTVLAIKEAELSISELDTGVKQIEGQSAQLLNQLKLIVGWPQGQIMKLGSVPKPNREFFGKIKLSDDTQGAISNSYSLQSKQAEHKYTEDKDRKNIIILGIEAQKEQIALSVSTQYYKIEEAHNTLLLEEQRLAVAEEKIKQSRLQHQLGLLAELALQTEENTYNAQQEAVTAAMNALFWEIENYKAIVAGLN